MLQNGGGKLFLDSEVREKFESEKAVAKKMKD